MWPPGRQFPIPGIDYFACEQYISKLTWIFLALFEGLVDVDEGEVVPLWVLELHVALGRVWFQFHGGNREARRS